MKIRLLRVVGILFKTSYATFQLIWTKTINLRAPLVNKTFPDNAVRAIFVEANFQTWFRKVAITFSNFDLMS